MGPTYGRSYHQLHTSTERLINVTLQLYRGLQSSFRPRSSFAKLIAVALLAIHMSNCYNQCRISNNSKCRNCYGPRAFGGPGVLCVKFILYYTQGNILEFRCPRQTLRTGDLYFTHDTETLFAESKLNVSFCLGICFCVKVHFTL